MTRTLLTLALCASISTLASREAAAGGRGGGYGSGGMQRGGGGMQRGESGGGMQRGGEGGGMSHSPSFSPPRSQEGGSSSAGRNPNENDSGSRNRNANSTNPGAGAAAGAAYSNRNQSGNHPNAAPAAAGAGAANRNQSQSPNAGAAAVGAGYANRNQNQFSNAGAAAIGASSANNNAYGYGGGTGSWNGNYGNGSLGSYGGLGLASPAYGYGSTPYMNPYADSGPVGTGQPANVPAGNAPAGNPSSFDYSQPVNPAAAPADPPQPADPSTTPAAQARQAFQAGDYANATQLTQQALGQAPNDLGLHQLLALDFFAQGNYEQAAAPLYAGLAVGPGWDWTTLIGNYTDVTVYTAQLRGLEAFVRANPRSAKAQFVLAYQYITMGHQDAAIRPLKAVLAIQPNDGVSAQLLDKIQPQPAAILAQPVDPARLPGVWVAQAPPNATITLSISDETNFTWAVAAPARPSVTIAGTYTLANGVLTLSSQDTPGGPLAGQVASTGDNRMSFKAVGAPTTDPGLQFAR